jgi:hypothetical protein
LQASADKAQEELIVAIHRLPFYPTGFFALLLTVLIPLAALAKTIQVPQQQPTIQDGINAASNGDVVLVSPGVYTENINFSGKAITVVSAAGPKTTAIDGGHLNTVVTFDTGETINSVLRGFTIQDGGSMEGDGGGVMIFEASPTIEENVIEYNASCGSGGGGGINVYFLSSAVIKKNIIRDNSQTSGCSGGSGGGIDLIGVTAVQVIENTIEENTWETSSGGGIALNGAGASIVMNNLILENYANGQGGGIYVVNSNNELIIQNLIVGNSADQGAGIYLSIPDGNVGALLVNNTVANNIGGDGSALYVDGVNNETPIYNNIFVGLEEQNAIYCVANNQRPPRFFNNDAYSPNGTGFQGTCSSESGNNGNISADPLFVNTVNSNYQLQSGSPAINAGDNNAPDLPRKDLADHPRIVGGSVDMGAYEFQNNN